MRAGSLTWWTISCRVHTCACTRAYTIIFPTYQPTNLPIKALSIRPGPSILAHSGSTCSNPEEQLSAREDTDEKERNSPSTLLPVPPLFATLHFLPISFSSKRRSGIFFFPPYDAMKRKPLARVWMER